MTINQAIIEFIDRKELRFPVAAKNYPVLLKRLAQFVGDCNLVGLTPAQLVSFQKHVQATYSRGNAVQHIRVLRSFVRFWNDRGVTHLPLEEIQPPRHVPIHYTAVSEADYQMIVDYLETEAMNFANLQKILIVRFLFETGIRVNELCNLKISDMNTREAAMQIKVEKRDIKDWIFWSEDTHALLKSFLFQRKHFAGDFLFVTYEGKMTPRTVQRFIKNLGITLSLPYDLTPHCFRHGRAAFIENHNGDILDIQQGLRHKDPRSSMWYVNISKERKGERMKKYL